MSEEKKVLIPAIGCKLNCYLNSIAPTFKNLRIQEKMFQIFWPAGTI